jgi:hypothetical protein
VSVSNFGVSTASGAPTGAPSGGPPSGAPLEAPSALAAAVSGIPFPAPKCDELVCFGCLNDL